jgi:hypothetical protein
MKLIESVSRVGRDEQVAPFLTIFIVDQIACALAHVGQNLPTMDRWFFNSPRDTAVRRLGAETAARALLLEFAGKSRGRRDECCSGCRASPCTNAAPDYHRDAERPQRS